MGFEEEQLREQVAIDLYSIGAIRFEEHDAQHANDSLIQVDLSRIISSPQVLKTVAALIWRLKPSFNSSLLCGVPYVGLALSTCISLKFDIPMVLRRESLHDDQGRVEGCFSSGQTCLVINDTMVSGNVILKTVNDLRKAGICVRETLVFLDRQVGGKQLVEEAGVQVRSVFTLEELVRLLVVKNRLQEKESLVANKFLKTFN